MKVITEWPLDGKQYVQAKLTYCDWIVKDEMYEVLQIFETNQVASGVAVVLNTKELMTLDSSFFK